MLRNVDILLSCAGVFVLERLLKMPYCTYSVSQHVIILILLAF